MNQHFRQAPILEADLDLVVSQPGDASRGAFEAFADNIRDEYPERYILPAISEDEKFPGLRCKSKDGVRFITMRPSGFTYSQLRPYTHWEDFGGEAHRLWDMYRGFVRPEKVERIGLRYLNQFDIPEPEKVWDYLNLYVSVPLEVHKDGLEGFFVQVQVPQDDLHCSMVINQTRVPASDPDTFSLWLDLDLYCQDVWSADDAALWNLLSKMRVRKNEIFNACITDKAREKIQ